MPQSRITSIWWASSGRLRIGRIGFGLRSENGYIRAPLPAARMTPTIRSFRSPTRLSRDLAAHQLAHHAHRVERADLLALFERPAAEADRHLGEPRAALRQPRRELGLEVEAVGLDVQVPGRATRDTSCSTSSGRRPARRRAARAAADHRQVAHPVEPPHLLDRSLEAAAVDDVGRAGQDAAASSGM